VETTRPATSYLTSGRAEDAYRRLTGYRFAQRFVEGNAVADVCWEEVGYGTRLLARSAQSAVGVSGSPGAVEVARAAHASPNARYEVSVLPELPLPPKALDAVVAFEVIEKLEWPGDLVAEARRVLKDEGVLIVSTPDKQAHSNDRNRRVPGHRREMYVSQFKEMLDKHFAHVDLYRIGTVAGGAVSRSEEEPSGPEVESTRFVLTEPSFDGSLPGADVVLAVCSDVELPRSERPYVLLDRDRRLVNECEDGREDAELLKGEIRQMQETEVQAFEDTLSIRNAELAYLKSRLERSEADLKHSEVRAKRLEERVRLVENSRGWRALQLLRGVRSGASSLRKPARG